MAQLRDAHTSALIAEGDLIDLVLLADASGLKAGVVGIGEVPKSSWDAIYDDVGLGFDPNAVRKAHQENVAGLESIENPSKDLKDQIAIEHKRSQPTTAKKDQLKRRLEAVRDPNPEKRAKVEPVQL